MNAAELPDGSIVECPDGLYHRKPIRSSNEPPWTRTMSTYRYVDAHIQRVLDHGATIARVGPGMS